MRNVAAQAHKLFT